MTTEETNRVIHRARGLCWHEVQLPPKPEVFGIKTCKHCGVESRWLYDLPWNPDYTSRSLFLDLWDWARGQPWWVELLREWASGDFDLNTYPQDHVENILNFGFVLVAQPFFAQKVAEWLKMRER